MPLEGRPLCRPKIWDGTAPVPPRKWIRIAANRESITDNPRARGLSVIDSRLAAILIHLRGGTGAVPSQILGRHSGRPSKGIPASQPPARSLRLGASACPTSSRTTYPLAVLRFSAFGVLY